MTGRVVGHYRIIEKIGAGGMGEVFRAHDERLGRDVALKLVRPTSSGNPDHLRRFEQEARAAAALNHPNIVAIYDVGVDQGVPYIVSELLEGQTLRQRLLVGNVPPRQAADYALQIVHGLITAHERHIVHRDLKPENLFVTTAGRVKILDFGVAKLQLENADRLENQLTVTKAGTLVGTVAYMSPEQLRGKAVDHRSDIFSVGTILYEMLAGRRAFRGETEVDTMTAVLLEQPPEISTEKSDVPEAFKKVVRHCLEKDPGNRFQSSKDLAFALENLSGTGILEISIDGKKGRREKITNAIPWTFAGVLSVATLLLLGRPLPHPAPAFEYHRVTSEHGTVYSARFVPPGQNIVYSAAWSGGPLQTFATVADSLLAQPLDLSGANLMAVSSSGELAVLMGGSHSAHLETDHGMLARAPLAGGSPREILGDVHWSDWDARGELAVVHVVDGHSRLEYPIGHVLFESKGWISHLRFSPRGDQLAFMDHPALWDDRGAVCVANLAGQVTVLSKQWESEDGLAWSSDGKEVWFTAAERGPTRALLAITLSGQTRTLLTLPIALTVQDISSDGRVLISLTTERLAMATTSRDHADHLDLSWHNWNVAKDISQDGQTILFEDASEVSGSNYAVAFRKLDGTPPVRLGEGSAGGLSPDGKWAIAIFTGSPERLELLPTGAGRPRPIPFTGLEHIENGTSRFLSDGKGITINGNEPGHGLRCYLLSLEGGKPKALTPEGVSGMAASPNGRYLLGASGTSLPLIYPMDGGPSRAIPGLEPNFVAVQWSRDSNSIYGYRSGEIPAKVYQVEILTGKKKVIQELLTEEPAGVVTVAPVVVNREASRFVYSYYQVLSELYVVTGVH